MCYEGFKYTVRISFLNCCERKGPFVYVHNLFICEKISVLLFLKLCFLYVFKLAIKMLSDYFGIWNVAFMVCK